MKSKKNQSAFLEYFGNTPKLKFLDFLIGNHFFDFNMTDMAREANISYNSLLSFFDEFLKKGIIVKTRKVGKSDMYKLNLENADWFFFDFILICLSYLNNLNYFYL